MTESTEAKPVSRSAVAPTEKALVSEISREMFGAKGWMKLGGVLMIIGGVFSIPVGVLYIIMGIMIFGAANRIDEATATGDKRILMDAMNKMKSYFIMLGVISLIGLIVAIAALVMAIAVIVGAANSGGIMDSLQEMFGMAQHAVILLA